MASASPSWHFNGRLSRGDAVFNLPEMTAHCGAATLPKNSEKLFVHVVEPVAGVRLPDVFGQHVTQRTDLRFLVLASRSQLGWHGLDAVCLRRRNEKELSVRLPRPKDVRRSSQRSLEHREELVWPESLKMTRQRERHVAFRICEITRVRTKPQRISRRWQQIERGSHPIVASRKNSERMRKPFFLPLFIQPSIELDLSVSDAHNALAVVRIHELNSIRAAIDERLAVPGHRWSTITLRR